VQILERAGYARTLAKTFNRVTSKTDVSDVHQSIPSMPTATTPSGLLSAPLRLVVAVENIAHAQAAIGEFGEVAGGRLDRGVPEPALIS
jgi:hypothetical protein